MNTRYYEIFDVSLDYNGIEELEYVDRVDSFLDAVSFVNVQFIDRPDYYLEEKACRAFIGDTLVYVIKESVK
jgi:hypothetical protein